MSDKSGIEWTEATWNPVTGCTKVSPGCAHCYAETFAERFRDTAGHYYTRGFDLQLRPEKLDQPLRWKRPRRIFVNSMSDLFHEEIPDQFIDQVFAVMAAANRHIYQVLTKRPERMQSYLAGLGRDFNRLETAARSVGRSLQFEGIPLVTWPLSNIWLGVSVENQRWAEERIPLLLKTPAAVRWLSCEPLLGPLDIMHHLAPAMHTATGLPPGRRAPMGEEDVAAVNQLARAALKPHGRHFVDWIVVGGESGPKHRPMDLAWAREIRDQCRDAGVPFFLKQLGGHPAKRGGELAVLDGQRHIAMPSQEDA